MLNIRKENFHANYAIFGPKYAFQIAKIHQNSMSKKFFSNRLFENPSDENLDNDLFDWFSMHIPHWKPPQMSFVNECTTLVFHEFGQLTSVQSKVLLLLRLLRFGVTRCCFSKSSIKIESFSYLSHLCISKRKKVMTIWKMTVFSLFHPSICLPFPNPPTFSAKQ